MIASIGFVLFLNKATAADKSALYQKNRNAYLHKDEQDRNILGQIFEMQTNLKRINSERGKLISKKEDITKQIEKLNPLVQTSELRLQTQKVDLQKRLLYIAKFQDMSFLKVLLSNQTPSELDRNLLILKNLTEKEYKSLKKYFASVKILQKKKIELSVKVKSVALLEKEALRKGSLLQKEAKKKNALLANIESQKKNLVEKLKRIREIASNNPADIKKQEFLTTILEPLFFEKRGTLPAPLHGVIAEKYGFYEDPSYKTKIRNKGIFIRATTDQQVKTVAAGNVAFEEKNLLNGYTVVIDHGDHYYSVYSYLKEPLVKKDDNVTEGQVISRGLAVNPIWGQGLYFELRHFSEPENPQAWLASQSRRVL